MAEELFVNNILIELPEKVVSRTLQVNDIAETKDRQSNYSNNIKIPRTSKNISTLELLGIAGSGSNIPYTNVSVKYVVDGVELITSGKGVVKNTNNNYNLVIYDGNITLSDLLGKKELSSLDYSAYNHLLTESNFTGSFGNTIGYIYCPAQFYERASVQTFSMDVMTPLFYISTLFNMIFTQNGYTVIGDILTDADFLCRVTSMNNGYERIHTETLSLKASETNIDSIDDSFIFSGQPEPQTYILDSYSAPSLKTYRVSFAGSIDVSLGTDFALVTYVNGSIRDTIPFESGASFSIDIDMALSSGDLLETGIVITPHLALDVGDPSLVVFEAGYTRKVYQNTITIPVNFEDMIGDTFQIDFVKDIMQRYGLSFRKIPFKDEFEFKKIQSIVTDKVNAEDWSNKYSGVLDEKYKPNYAKTNYAKYQYDSSDSNIEQTFADGELTVANENLAETKTMFSSIFKASGLVSSIYYGMKHWILKTENDVDTLVINNDGLRLFCVNLNAGVLKYHYKYGESTSFFTFTGTIPSLQFVTYQTDIDNNYLEFQSILNDYKDVVISLNLSLLDIVNIDFFKLKYFEQLGAYYYLNKIVNYKKGKVTKGQLIRIGADIQPPISEQMSYAGSSVYAATLTSPGAGEMEGEYAGASIYSATLRFDGVTASSISKFAQTVPSVCEDTVLITRYHNGVDAEPKVNDTIYTDAPGTIVLNGGDSYWKLSTGYRLQINSSGLVIQKSACA